METRDRWDIYFTVPTSSPWGPPRVPLLQEQGTLSGLVAHHLLPLCFTLLILSPGSSHPHSLGVRMKVPSVCESSLPLCIPWDPHQVQGATSQNRLFHSTNSGLFLVTHPLAVLRWSSSNPVSRTRVCTNILANSGSRPHRTECGSLSHAGLPGWHPLLRGGMCHVGVVALIELVG